MRLGYQKNERQTTKVLKFLGVLENEEKETKLSIRHQILNPLVNNDVDYNLSHDC